MPGCTVHTDFIFLSGIYSGEKRLFDSTGTWQVSLGAPLGGVCSPTHARVPGAVRKSPWATRRVKGIDPRAVDSRTRGRACARPSVTLLHALGYRDTLVAPLVVVVARPRRLVESTRFVLSEMLHFGSLEVYCALGCSPNPTRKLVSSQLPTLTSQTSSIHTITGTKEELKRLLPNCGTISI